MEIKAKDIKKYEELHNIELPKDTISETGLIATLLIHPEYIYRSEYILPRMFYDRPLGAIYHIIKTLISKGIVDIDTFLIFNEIEGNQGYKKVFEETSNISDVMTYLEDLKILARNTIEEYELLANKVVTASFKRESIMKLDRMKESIFKSEADINELNYNMQQDITDFSKVYICNKEVLTLGDQVDKIWQGILNKRNGGVFGFPSKFSELNKYATYEKTELMMIAAPGKTGKSQFLSNEAWNKAMAGVPTVYIDRELSTENHMIRLLAYLTGINNRKIKEGNLTLIEEKLIKEKLEFIKTLPYTHIYKPVADTSELFMTIKSLQLKQGIEFLVYDYVKANDGSDSDKEYQKLGKQTDWLKNDIAGALNLAALAACQMDDNGTKVADSQKILRNCSTLAFLTRKTKEEIINDGVDSGNMKLRIKANRNGEINEEDEYINLVLEGNICTMRQAKKTFTQGQMPY